tara:strand:+ start:57 stop:413 length:357 start_codon:yes stop_codon:yes gene_type:complete
MLSPFCNDAYADTPKLNQTCGCNEDAYIVYGAGSDMCSSFINEYSVNSDFFNIDNDFAQSLGWIAGFMSATNFNSGIRDNYDMDIRYVAHKVSEWCEQNLSKTLSNAMEAITGQMKIR